MSNLLTANWASRARSSLGAVTGYVHGYGTPEQQRLIEQLGEGLQIGLQTSRR
jgi:hypothetical protein